MITRLRTVSSFLALAVTTAGCSDAMTTDEALDTVTEAVNPTSCATAARDWNLNASADQAAGKVTPDTYDNPGCNEGYIVEFDGTVNGEHVGYKLADPRPLPFTVDGIRVIFPQLVPNQISECTDTLRGGGYLYEKLSNGTWQLRETVFAGPYSVSDHGITRQCNLPNVIFRNVQHGTATNPHIYRVAVTMDVLQPSMFVGSHPDGQGYGPILVRAADADHP